MSKTLVFNEVKALLEDGANVINDSTFKIKTIRLWNNQILNLSKEAAFAFPAVFVEFQDIEYFGKGRRTKELKALMKLHIVQKEFRKENLDNLDFLDKVARVMEGYQSDVINLALSRVFEVQDTDHGNLIVWEQDYPLQAKDLSVTDMIGSTVIDGGVVGLEQDPDLVQTNPVLSTGNLDSIFNIQGLAHVINVDRHGSITFDGTKVEKINDLNGGGGDFEQTTAGKRPERVQVGDHFAMRFAGAEALKSVNTLDKTNTNSLEVFMVIGSLKQTSKVILESSADYTAETDSFIINYDSSDKIAATVLGDVGSASAESDEDKDKVFLLNFQMDKSKASKEVTAFLEGLNKTATRTSDSDNLNSFGDQNWFIGARNEASLFITMDLYYMAVFDKALTEEKRKDVGKSLMIEYGIQGIELLPLQP